MPANVKRLNGIFPEVGTIVGPDWSGLRWTVSEVDDRGVSLRPANAEDYRLVIASGEPRSLAERGIINTGHMLGF